MSTPEPTPIVERPKPKLPLIYVLLMGTIAIIGLSHVQTSMKLDRVEHEYQRLKLLNTRLDSTSLSAGLRGDLNLPGHARVIDLVENRDPTRLNKLTQDRQLELEQFLKDHELATETD